MTILFDVRRKVKPARRFGAGLLAYAPMYRVEYTAADADWLAAERQRIEDARD